MTATTKPTAPAPAPWWAVLLGIAAIVGAITVAQNTGSGPTTVPTVTMSSTTAPPATTSTSTPSAAYRRPFGDTATWNRPFAELGLHPRSAEFSQRLYEHANKGGPGRLSLYFDDYSYPMYDARTATRTIRAFHVVNGCCRGSLPDGASIPWGPTWHTGGPSDNDKIMIVIDPATGREWDLWLVQLPDGNQSSCWLAPGFVSGQDLCVGQADLIQGPDGKPSDYRTATHTYPVGGAWMQSQIGLITPQEIAAGQLRHAVNWIVHNTMFGPACTPAQKADPAQFGQTCGSWVNPASRLEWPAAPQQCGANTQANTVAGRSATVPEGGRFAVHKSPAEVEAWATGRGYTGQLRRTMIIIATALTDQPTVGFGGIIENTSCYDWGMFTTGRNGPDRDAWNALGIPTDPAAASRLLDGFITEGSIRMAGESAPQTVGSLTPR